MSGECCACGKEAKGKGAKTFQLRPEELLAIKSLGQEPLTEYAYCGPCMRVMTNRDAGASFLKGVLLTRLRASGVANADRIAQRFHEFLLKRASQKPVS